MTVLTQGKIKIDRKKPSGGEGSPSPLFFCYGGEKWSILRRSTAYQQNFYRLPPQSVSGDCRKEKQAILLSIDRIHGRPVHLHSFSFPYPPPPCLSFKSSARSQRSQSGLDYTKSILIKDNAYIDATVPALVDQDEYKETMVNLPRIVQEVFFVYFGITG